MALVQTTATLIRQYNAFTGLSAVQRSQSGIARAEVVYYNVNDSFPAAGAGNLREYVTAQQSLPKDFGYVLTDAFVKIEAVGGANIGTEMIGNFRIFPGGVLGPQINTVLAAKPSAQSFTTTTPIGDTPANAYNTNYPSFGAKGSITYVLENKPTSIIYPFQSNQYTTTPNPASLWEFQIGEQAEGLTQAYQVSSYVRFVQYDIDQSYNYVIQSPQLTR